MELGVQGGRGVGRREMADIGYRRAKVETGADLQKEQIGLGKMFGDIFGDDVPKYRSFCNSGQEWRAS